jgi:hypothetical protein
MVDEELLPRPNEAEQVHAWRLEQLLTAGYPIPIAEQLARSGRVELHQALDLLDKGCSPQLAGEILL